jgi:xylulokinase
VIAEGSAYNYIGSSSWIALTTASPIYDPTCRTFTFAHIIPGMFMPTGTMQAAGASYQWLRNQVCTEEYRVARDSGESSYELMNRIANGSPPGANGLLYLPYLMGERSPRWNPNASAAFIGLTIRHTRADMIRAVLEGVSLNLKVILDAFQAQGAKIEVIRLIGGGARGSFWNHILADIYNLPVQRLQILEEATSLGAALAGGVGVGLYSNFSMIEKMNPVSEIIIPDPANRAVYNRSSKLFETAYETLLPLYERMAQPT